MDKLKIPTQINLAWELLPGIGKQELRQSLLALVPALALTVSLAVLLPSPGVRLGCLLGFLLFAFATYGFFATVDGSQSVYKYLRNLLRYTREQQAYYYRTEREEVDYLG